MKDSMPAKGGSAPGGKIACFDLNAEDQKVLAGFFEASGVDARGVIFFAEKLDEQTVKNIPEAEIVSVFINSVVNKEIIDALPKLKLINTSSTGFDHIDVSYAASKNIAVTNVPAYGSRTVAEYTFALILGLSRKTFLAYRQVKDNHDFDISHFQGFNLQGKTLGVIGTGRIGINVIQIAKGFDLTVVAFDPHPSQDRTKELNFTYLPLEEVLEKSDIVTLHVPYMKETYHLINKDNIGKFKKGALLINTSRGEVADTEAILQGVKQGILAGVGLDVIEGERELKDEWHVLGNVAEHQKEIKMLLTDHVLMDLPQVALTPHIAFFSAEAKHEILQTTAQNLANFLKNNPTNLVSVK